MPISLPSSLDTSQDYIPAVGNIRKFAGLAMHFPNLAALNTAVTAEIANIAGVGGIYSDGQPFTVSGEAATRKWSVSGQHARNVTLPGGKIITLAASSNTIFATSGAPSSGTGNDGDYGVDTTAGLVYGPRASGTWPSGVSYVVGGGGGSLATLNAIPGWSPLNRLSPNSTKSICIIDTAIPAAGTATTLAAISGAGTLAMVQITLGGNTSYENIRIQIFTDGNVVPDVDVDVATMLLTALDAKATKQSAGTAHVITSIGSSSIFWSGGILFPVPFSNGCVVKLFNPVGGGASNNFYSQIVYHPNVTSTLRLRSKNVPQMNAVAYGRTAQIVLVDSPQNKGSLVWLSFAATGTGGGSQPTGYLERQWYVAVDGESTTPDSQGAINSSFGTSGGEDLFLNGWYFAGLTQIANPWVLVTAANNSNATSVAGVDLLGLYGGIPFNNELKVGWSLKDGPDGAAALSNLNFAYSLLYYVDTAQPFVPSAPQVVTGSATSSTSGLVSWTAPASPGSVQTTGYTVTLSPGGATQTVAANVLSASFTGLTTGTAYTPTVVATNSVGNSTNATGSAFTPVSVTVPGAPTGATATAGNASATVTFTAPSSNGGATITGYTATSSPGSFTGSVSGAAASPITVSGLANGTAYTFTVHATNSVGNSAESSASSSVTPVATAVISDNFNRADASTLGSAQTGQTWNVTADYGTGTGYIQGNAAYTNSSTAANTGAYVSAGKADVDITAIFSVIGVNASYSGIFARFADINNHLDVVMNSSTVPTAYVLQTRVSSSYTTLATIAVTPTAGDSVRLKVTGSSADVYINSTHFGPYSIGGASTTAQNVGFVMGNNSGASTARVDSIVVY